MKKNAFTLLELLIVIGIIGILVALATVSYSATQKAGRDSRRKQDMVAIQNAMEQYYSQNSYSYPTSNCLTSLTTPTNFLKIGVPSDPDITRSYTNTCAANSYCVCARMEKTNSGNSSSSSCVWTSSAAYYCVGNLQ